MFWNVDDPEVLTSYSLENLHFALRGAVEAGHESVLIVTNIDPLLFGLTLSDALDDLGWEVADSEVVEEGVATLVEIEKTNR